MVEIYNEKIRDLLDSTAERETKPMKIHKGTRRRRCCCCCTVVRLRTRLSPAPTAPVVNACLKRVRMQAPTACTSIT